MGKLKQTPEKSLWHEMATPPPAFYRNGKSFPVVSWFVSWWGERSREPNTQPERRSPTRRVGKNQVFHAGSETGAPMLLESLID
jgi:hypothetical protein